MDKVLVLQKDETVVTSRTALYVKGNKARKVTFSFYDEGKGKVIVNHNKAGTESWQEYYPEVLGCKVIDKI